MSFNVDFLKKVLYIILVFANLIITKRLQNDYEKVTNSIDFFYKI